jgi:3-isopropylmalate/(R)-2-methylmalate dehydratase small subunit
MAAIELPREKIDALFRFADHADAVIEVDVEQQQVTVKGGGKQESFAFDVSPFDKALVLAGGWVDYADQRY